MTSYPTRRKFVTITAAAAGMGLLPFTPSRAEDQAALLEWQGVSLGSVATIRIYHPDRDAGRKLIDRVVAEGGVAGFARRFLGARGHGWAAALLEPEQSLEAAE